jgi:hypothetical protein
LRAGYYKDLASKWSVEIKLKDWIEGQHYLKGSLNLSGIDLTTLYYQQYLIVAKEIDLRNNLLLRKKYESLVDVEVLN